MINQFQWVRSEFSIVGGKLIILERPDHYCVKEEAKFFLIEDEKK